uniref:guanylate cyclase n=1 Tax=Meloidogyne enterolobii TaxID=390850 RepID=A0A6V7U8B6_MELEN|nr:unnamed protein product [Meloidogyne enterolobii]
MLTFLIFLHFIFQLNLYGVLCQNISNNSTLTTNSILTTTTIVAPTTTTQPPSQILSASSLPQLQIKIGLLGANASQYRPAYGFGQSVPAISIAIQRARNEHLIDFVNFTFTWLICDCDQVLAVGYSNKLILDQNVDVIIGPPCVTSALDAALPASFYSLPIFLWGATIATILNDNNIYPTVTNLNSNTLCLAQAIEAVLLQFQWYEVSLVYIPDDIRRVGYFFPQDFQNVVNANPNLTIVYNQQMAATTASMHNALTQIKNRSRIVIANIDNIATRRNFLLAITDTGISQSNEYVFIFAQLRSLGMLQQITSNSNISKFDDFWKVTNGVDDGRDGDALKAARRAIIVDLENQSNSQIDIFNAKVVAEFGKPPFNCVNECMGGPNDQIPASYARSLHDTTYAYLRALNKTTEKFGYLTKDLARNGTLINNMSKGEFQGETGLIIFDDNGNRQPNYFLTMLDASDQANVVMNITVIGGVATLIKRYTNETGLWANRGGKRPLYKPICGYTGTECPQNITTYILIGVGLVLLLLVATLGGIGYAVREKLKEKERLTRECLIPFGELKNIKELKSNEDMRSLEANKSLKSLQSSQSGSTKLTSMDDKKLETENYVHFLYNREVVFAIKYQVRVRIFNEDFILLRKLRQLDHDNLNKFCGLCTDAPILYAIWKHCQRGSLKDLIAKEQYVGDSFVMFTLMRDIASGLIALHGSFVGAHGMLSSENCLINDRWQVKISDFGLNMIRESQTITKRSNI